MSRPPDSFQCLSAERLAIVVGGAVGTLLRAALATALPPTPAGWPWATFIVNVLGAMLLGGVAQRTAAGDRRRSLFGTGLCGGLTTFSAFAFEVLGLLDHRRLGLAGGYAAVSVAAGLTAVVVGSRLAGRRGS